MAIFKRGRIYWYKFMWNGAMIRESTKQGKPIRRRATSNPHTGRGAPIQEDARQDARLRLKCSEVLLCDECEKWFNAEGTRRQEGHGFVPHTRLKHREASRMAGSGVGGELWRPEFYAQASQALAVFH